MVGQSYYYATISNINSTITKQFTLGLNPSTTYNGYCGNVAKKDTIYQFQHSFPHNSSLTDIIFSITTNNANIDAIWIAKQFIMAIRTCSPACLSCSTTGTSGFCFSCNSTLGYMLNNQSCYNNCRVGFGYTDDISTCVWCDLHCSTCYKVMDNCSTCVTSGTWKSYLYFNSTAGYNTCVSQCPNGHFANAITNSCELCVAPCTTCQTNSSSCLSCASGGLLGSSCYSPCPIGYNLSNFICISLDTNEPKQSKDHILQIIFGSIGGVIGLIIFIFIIRCCVKRIRRSNHVQNSSQPNKRYQAKVTDYQTMNKNHSFENNITNDQMKEPQNAKTNKKDQSNHKKGNEDRKIQKKHKQNPDHGLKIDKIHSYDSFE